MRPRVLVVDDDRLVADTLRLVFVANGFDSEACYSAADGLKMAKSFSPELLLCDVAMPGGDGVQLAAQVFRELPTCQMIMLTAYLTNGANSELESLRRQTPLKILHKPCPPETLIEEVTSMLKQRRRLPAAG